MDTENSAYQLIWLWWHECFPVFCLLMRLPKYFGCGRNTSWLRRSSAEFPKASWVSLEGSLRGFQNTSDMVEILRDLDEVQQGASGSVWRSFRRAFGLSLFNHKQLSFRDRDWFNYGLGSQISGKRKRYEQLAKEELKLKYVKTRKYCVQEKLQETFIVLVSCIPWFRWQQGYVLSSIDTSELKFISQMVLNATFSCSNSVTWHSII